MSASIKTLQDTSGNTIYPQSKAEAIYTSNNTTVESEIAKIALKANLESPTFTGTPKAPTPASSDNSTNIATTAYVQTVLSGFSGGTEVVLSKTDPGLNVGGIWLKEVD